MGTSSCWARLGTLYIFFCHEYYNGRPQITLNPDFRDRRFSENVAASISNAAPLFPVPVFSPTVAFF
jgi:hypothetical protein